MASTEISSLVIEPERSRRVNHFMNLGIDPFHTVK